MPGRRLKAFLDARKIPYELLIHSQAFTAQQTAEMLHVHGREFAKPVVVHANGRRIMAVVPAHIVFNAGSHSEAIRMKFRNFAEVVAPTIADIAVPYGTGAQTEPRAGDQP